MDAEALVIVMNDVRPDIEDQFNRWYENEYMPKLLKQEGLLGGRRFRAIQGKPKYLAAYDLEDSNVPERPAFWRSSALNPEADSRSRAMNQEFLNRIRGVYQRVLTLPDPEPTDISSARVLFVRGLGIPPQHEEEFNEWYNTEHIPNLSKLPGVLRSRRFKLDPTARDPIGDPPAYLAVYELKSIDAMRGEEWDRAVNTPWTMRIRRLYIDRLWNVYERIR